MRVERFRLLPELLESWWCLREMPLTARFGGERPLSQCKRGKIEASPLWRVVRPGWVLCTFNLRGQQDDDY